MGEPLREHVLLGSSPCDGCKWRERCGVEQLACARFSMFLNGESERRWRAAPCAPRSAIYAALFDPKRRRAAAHPAQQS